MSEIRKRKKGQVLNNNERQLILNLMTYLREKHPDKSISEIIREIATATGCSERTIYKIKKEANRGITVAPVRTRVRKKENKNSRNIKYDSFVKSLIRKKVYNYFAQNIPPTLNAILSLVNNDPDLPNFKRSTLHTLLKEIGFVYEQKGKKSLLSERGDLIKCRQEYLRNIQKYRLENQWIIYTGETQINVVKKELLGKVNDHCKEEKNPYELPGNNISECATVNTVIINAPQLFSTDTAIVYTFESTSLASGINNGFINLTAGQGTVEELASFTELPLNVQNSTKVEEPIRHETCESKTEQKLKNAPHKEFNLKIMHACSNQGFLQGTELVTLCKEGSNENDSYEHWFVEKLLPKIPPNSIVISDSTASCRKKKENGVPDSSWKKQHIKNWLLSENISIGNISQKKELLDLVKNVRPLFSLARHRIDEMAEKKGVKIVNLPPFHYELNPLNLVWAQIKNYVRANMRSFKIRKIKEVISEGLHSVSQINWLNYINSVKETEELFLTIDDLENQK